MHDPGYESKKSEDAVSHAKVLDNSSEVLRRAFSCQRKIADLGILHNDLKPDNIGWEVDNRLVPDFTAPKWFDFGLATWVPVKDWRPVAPVAGGFAVVDFPDVDLLGSRADAYSAGHPAAGKSPVRFAKVTIDREHKAGNSTEPLSSFVLPTDSGNMDLFSLAVTMGIFVVDGAWTLDDNLGWRMWEGAEQFVELIRQRKITYKHVADEEREVEGEAEQRQPLRLAVCAGTKQKCGAIYRNPRWEGGENGMGLGLGLSDDDRDLLIMTGGTETDRKVKGSPTKAVSLVPRTTMTIHELCQSPWIMEVGTKVMKNCDEPEKLHGAEDEGEPGHPGARGIPCATPRPASAAAPTPTTSSTTASGSGCVLPPPAVDDVGSYLLSAAADELRTEGDEEVDEEPGVQVEAEDVEQPLIYDANRKSFAELLQTLPIARMYPELTERCVPVLDKWKETLPRSAWRKLMKKTQSPMPRVLKELNEAAPIIDRVLAFVKKNFHQKMNPDHDVAAGSAHGGQSEANDAPFTIVDVGSGLGILSMFLAELLLPEEVKECYLVDKMWPTELNEKTFSDGLHMTKEHLKVDGATGKSLFPIPLRSLKMDIKKGRDLADLVHYIFENGTKATRGSGNRIGGRGPVEDDHIKVGEREDEEQNRQECQKQASSSAVPSPNPNRILLLGVHLCGSLSLRFVELVNKNPGTVEFAALKPCCLPGKMHLHHEMLYRVGKHEFTAQDVYYPDDQALVCEPVVNKEKAGHAADAQVVNDVLEDEADEELLEDQFAGAVNCDDDGLPDTFMFIERRRNANANAAAVGEGAVGGASSASQHNRGLVASKRITAHGKTFTYPRHLLHEGAAAAPGHAAAAPPPPPSQAVVYEKFMPQRVSDFVHRGRNCNVICYGQTGSGKTHTMFAPPGMMAKAGRKDFDLGPLLSPSSTSTSASASPPSGGSATTTASREVPAASSAAGSSDRADRVPENEKMKLKLLADAEHLGLCPRGMIEIFRLVSEERASRGRRLLLTASIVELSAMEGNVDLLLKQKRAAADGAMFGRNTAASGVQLDRATKPPQLQGMSQVTLEQEDDLRTIFAAIACRNTAGTGLNHSSSRTHCFVFLLLYELFVDLAGSERLEDAHNGQANWRSGVLRVFEGMMTNYSLMMLSSCVRELVALKSPEKRKNFSLRLFMVDLVFLLEESLLRPEEAGTLFVVCVSALGRNAQQSRFALEFGETIMVNMLGKSCKKLLSWVCACAALGWGTCNGGLSSSMGVAAAGLLPVPRYLEPQGGEGGRQRWALIRGLGLEPMRARPPIQQTTADGFNSLATGSLSSSMGVAAAGLLPVRRRQLPGPVAGDGVGDTNIESLRAVNALNLEPSPSGVGVAREWESVLLNRSFPSGPGAGSIQQTTADGFNSLEATGSN
eukprot:g11767.t1